MAIIAFAGISIYNNITQGSRHAKELIDFADQSAPILRTQFTQISNKTLFLENKPESYDQITQDLDNLINQLDTLLSQIPTRNNDQASVRLQTELKDFFLAIKINAEQIRQEHTDKAKLLDSTLQYGGLKSAVESKDIAKLKQAHQAGSELLNFDRTRLDQVQDELQKSALQKRIDQETKRLETLNQILQETQTNISPEQINTLQQAYANQWPIQEPPFPRITKDKFENTQFGQDIQVLQGSIAAVKKQYNLN